ncbi:hypothetical protein [Zobellella sp. An-6]|uniref:hypothetical protein n=1 Tax=Zobellella sp. An-6 TaxID=3400218 RepID=UPI004042F70F
MKDKHERIPVAEVEASADLGRRRFLAAGSMVALGVGALSASGLEASAREALAREFTLLGAEAGNTLLVLARDIFPHDHIEDRYYRQALAPLEAQAADDAELRQLLAEGTATLDELAGARFQRPYAAIERESDRLMLLYLIEHGAFFQRLKGHLVTGFYDNKEVWPLFGYEGSSWEQGGYLNRGFNDIDWLEQDA